MGKRMTSKEIILKLKKQNPDLTPAAIARMTGLSRERVRQVLLSLGLPTNLRKGQHGLQTVICDNCGRQFTRRVSQIKHSLVKDGYRHIWCSHKCLGQARRSKRITDFRKLKSANRLPEQLN